MSDYEELDYAPDLYTLLDEEGNEQSFELLDILEEGSERYFALLPFYEDPSEMLEDDGEIVVLKAVEMDGEEMMASIDNDEEYERVGNIFLKKFADMYEDEMGADEE